MIMRVARRIGRAWELGSQYVQSALKARQGCWSFDNVQCFCLFVGYPRSGHTLVGSLLDAHRHVLIGLELDALRYIKFGFQREQLFYLLAENSRLHAQRGRQWTGYSYQVPGQWQGQAEQVKVIGDKRGGDSARRLSRDFTLLDRLRETVKVPVKVVHVVRNPYDNIATMVLRGDARTLPLAIELYRSLTQVAERVRRHTAPEDFITVHHERFIADPQVELSGLCNFLGIDAPPSYLADCSAIVFDAPHKTRYRVPWSSCDIKSVSDICLGHDFLARYTFSSGEMPTPVRNSLNG